MAQFLPAASLPEFFSVLSGFGELHGPVITDDGVLAFRPVSAGFSLCLDNSRTLVPPKKYLLPPRDTILLHDRAGYRRPEELPPKIVLLGVRPCDLAAIAYLDRVFLGEKSDPSYAESRTRLTLVGFSCTPDEFCFCGTLQTPQPAMYDLFLHDTDGGFTVAAGSDTGQSLKDKARHLLSHMTDPLPEPCSCREEEAIREATARGESFEGSPLWEEFAARCLSCGACSLCCPTCYCFDVREYGGPADDAAERVREWDNCLFVDHGEIAGGHNFRPTRRERFRYRFQHKYLGFGPTRGIVSCVGCGRCREVCPVRIDLLRLFLGESGEEAP